MCYKMQIIYSFSSQHLSLSLSLDGDDNNNNFFLCCRRGWCSWVPLSLCWLGSSRLSMRCCLHALWATPTSFLLAPAQTPKALPVPRMARRFHTNRKIRRRTKKKLNSALFLLLSFISLLFLHDCDFFLQDTFPLLHVGKNWESWIYPYM